MEQRRLSLSVGSTLTGRNSKFDCLGAEANRPMCYGYDNPMSSIGTDYHLQLIRKRNVRVNQDTACPC